MKNLILSFVLMFGSLVSFSQVVTFNATEVEDFTIYDFYLDTNGFGRMIEGGLTFESSDIKFLDLSIDLTNKIFIKTSSVYYNSITDTFKIESIELLGDTINFSYTNYDKIKKINYVSFASFTTDNEGNYAVFISYDIIDRNIFGYFILGTKTSIKLQ